MWEVGLTWGFGFSILDLREAYIPNFSLLECLDPTKNQTWKKFVYFRYPTLKFSIISAEYPTKNDFYPQIHNYTLYRHFKHKISLVFIGNNNFVGFVSKFL